VVAEAVAFTLDLIDCCIERGKHGVLVLGYAAIHRRHVAGMGFEEVGRRGQVREHLAFLSEHLCFGRRMEGALPDCLADLGIIEDAQRRQA